MLKEEEAKEIVNGYLKIFEDSKIKPGILYNVDTVIVSSRHNNQEVKADGVIFGIQKFKYAMYPHIECKFISNLDEIGDVTFIAPEHYGDSINEHTAGDPIVTDVSYSLKDFENFLKSINLNGIKKEIYLEEKKAAEAHLQQVNEILKEAGVEE